MLHLQYGTAATALTATPVPATPLATVPAAPLTTFSLPNTSGCTANGSTNSYALLNGHSQVCAKKSSKIFFELLKERLAKVFSSNIKLALIPVT